MNASSQKSLRGPRYRAYSRPPRKSEATAGEAQTNPYSQKTMFSLQVNRVHLNSVTYYEKIIWDAWSSNTWGKAFALSVLKAHLQGKHSPSQAVS